ncbi:MAG: NAD(P)H-dependent oxidoreductase [Tabrizicola flagellatus]|uniref:NAD(P)H-dependent oxidoreductase n=1 Tax=Tabrizicola flagellatus TaxID=2593021 RepID=UPI00391A807B
MRLLVIHAHPVPESFNSALCRIVVETAREAGHEVRLLDLYAEGFDPVMSVDERRRYHDDDPPDPKVAAHIAHLKWAEGLIFVYPTWWYSQPAMLKGWMDRVWRPGVTFTVPTPDQPMRPALTNVCLIGVITTLGSPRWFWTFLMGAPGRKILLRGLRFCTARRTRTFWLGLHEMDTTTDAQRRRYMEQVRARIARIPV